MTRPASGDGEGIDNEVCAFPSGSGDLSANLAWIARVQDTAARFSESPEVTDEGRNAVSARLDAVMGRYHQFMGVSGLENEVAGDRAAAIGPDEVEGVSFWTVRVSEGGAV